MSKKKYYPASISQKNDLCMQGHSKFASLFTIELNGDLMFFSLYILITQKQKGQTPCNF